MIHCVICHGVISTEPAGMSRIIIIKSCSFTMMFLRNCSHGGDDFWSGGLPRLNECSRNTELKQCTIVWKFEITNCLHQNCQMHKMWGYLCLSTKIPLCLQWRAEPCLHMTTITLSTCQIDSHGTLPAASASSVQGPLWWCPVQKRFKSWTVFCDP